MKKLLSLLSVLTISGTAVPTTIAASPYQKEENIHSDINSQTNNFEILKRSKRNINNLSYNRNSIDVQDNFTHYDLFLHI